MRPNTGPQQTIRRDDAGQALPLVALLVAFAALALLVVGRVGEAAVLTARARTAADAAALAGAAAGRPSAERLAIANGATLVSYERDDDEVVVRVHFRGRTARSTARRIGGPAVYAPGSSIGGLAPAMRAALARAGQLLGAPVPVTSGYRSPARQAELYAGRGSNPYPVAPPGTSKHERGLAIDVPLTMVPRLLSVAPMAGLCRPLPLTDPVHFELCPSR